MYWCGGEVECLIGPEIDGLNNHERFIVAPNGSVCSPVDGITGNIMHQSGIISINSCMRIKCKVTICNQG